MSGVRRLPATGVSRRHFLRLVGGGTGLALLAACAPAPQAAAPTPSAAGAAGPTAAAQTGQGQASQAQAGQPKRGGTVRSGLVGDLGQISPHTIGPQPLQTIFAVWDRLIAYDERGTPQPMLAESFEFSTDRTRLQFKLRPNVQFHSGRELTSDDVKWNLLRVRNPAVNATQFNKQSQWFTTIDTSDKYTVTLSMDQARPSVLDFFDLFNIADPATTDSQAPGQQLWIGTGPFKLTEYVVGDHLHLARNESYWRAGHPYLDEFDVAILHDGAAAAVQLEAGALDLVFDPPATDAQRLAFDPKFAVHVNDRSGINGVMNINVTQPPMDNKLFRQAVHYAVNRQRYVDTILLKRGEARSLPWTPASPAYDAERKNYFSFDLDKARSLLQQAGVSNPTIDFVYLSTEPPVASGGLAQILQSDLASIGVNLSLRSIEFAALADTMNNLRYGMAYDAIFRYGEFEPSTGMTTSASYNYEKNFAGFKSDQYTSLITALQVTADDSKRQALHTQLNDLLLDECFTLPIASNPPVIATAANVQGVGWNAHDALVHDELWLA